MADSLIQQLEAQLGIQSLEADDRFPFSVAIDNGLEGIADPADVFVNKRTGEIVPGHTEEVANALEDIANLLKPPARDYWLEKTQRFWSGKNTARPVGEGIGNVSTSSLKVPQAQDDQPWLTSMVDEIKGILEKNGVPVKLVASDVSAYLQDSFITFDDGTIGVPPKFEEDKLYKLYVKMFSRYGSVPKGGASFKRGTSDNVLSDLSKTHKVRQMASFIEGGNVIFARNGQGLLKAIVGEETLQYTETFYNIDRGKAIALVATDLNMQLHISYTSTGIRQTWPRWATNLKKGAAESPP